MPIWKSETSSKMLLGAALGAGLGVAAFILYRRSRQRLRTDTHSENSLHSTTQSEQNQFSSEANFQNMNLEEKSLLTGGPRVKFASEWMGTLDDFFMKEPELKDRYVEVCTQLAEQMEEYEHLGVTPVAPDGKVGGNCSAIIRNEQSSCILLSKSGKAPHKKMNIFSDFVIIAHFDSENWTCAYYAQNESTLPTSDAPLHYAILNDTQMDMDWSDYPEVALHGHAFETEEEAHRYGYPISTEETLFSTPEDTAALMGLMKRYPYPQHHVFVRKGHGFVLVARDPHHSKAVFDECVKPHLF